MVSFLGQILPPLLTKSHYSRQEMKTRLRLLRSQYTRPYVTAVRSPLQPLHLTFDSRRKSTVSHLSSSGKAMKQPI